MDIRCRKTQCKYNDRHTCRAKGITINSEDICKSYDPDENKTVIDSSKKLFKEVPEYAPQRDIKKMKVECQNCCVLNCSGRCCANGITINDINSQPFCMTFVKK